MNWLILGAYKSSRWMIGLAVIVLVLLGCCNPFASVIQTDPMPDPAVGVPVVGSDGWQIIVDSVRQEAKIVRTDIEISGGQVYIGTTTHLPGDESTFLVVEVTAYDLDPLNPAAISTDDITAVGQDGKSYASDELSEFPGELVFEIPQAAAEQTFDLNIGDAPAIPVSAGQEAALEVSTEIGFEPASLPRPCKVKRLKPLDDEGRLAFYRSTEEGLTLGYVNADGSRSTPVCEGVAFGTLQLAADGAALLHIVPRQGWSNLYLVESDGKTSLLVKEGLNIVPSFDPSGRWVLFTVELVGAPDTELHVLDRETGTMSLVKTGEYVSFDFVSDGRLAIDYRADEDSDRQYFVGPASGESLELLGISEDVPGSRWLAADGAHVLYRDISASWTTLFLYLADLDGSNARVIVEERRSRLDGVLAPNGRFALASVVSLTEDDSSNRAEFQNLDTGESQALAAGSQAFTVGFSRDSQWAYVIARNRSRHTLYIIQTGDGSIETVDHVVSAHFAPDSARLAYTVDAPGGEPEMQAWTLADQSVQSLGSGVVTGWYPFGVTP